MYFQVLGPLRVHTASGEMPIGAVRERTVLAMLLLHTGETTTLQTLVDAVWGEAPPQNARNQLHGCVSRLRKQLATAGVDRQVIATTTNGYRIDVESGALDLRQFRQLRDEGRTAVVGGDLEGARERYRSALQLWRGSVLGDVDSQAVRRIAVVLEEERAQALEERIEIDMTLGEAGTLVPELTSLVEHYPYREALYGALMQVLYRAGRQAEALALYRRVRQILNDELGAEPGEGLKRLHQAILRQEPDVRPLPSTAASTVTSQMVPRELPTDLRGFSGRVEQLAMLDKLLPESAAMAPAPVVIAAITGTAGVGKSALALHWAHRAAERFPDGQLYVDLRGFDQDRPPTDPAEAVRGFLDVLQVPPQRIPVSAGAQAGLFRSLLADRRMLVLLDNARDAAQVRPLLPNSPRCMVLITSRNQLPALAAVEGAHPIGLDLLTHAEARELLEKRLGAGRLAAEPEAVDEVITFCDRLPLALAVVAARAVVRPEFPIAVLARALRDARPRLHALSSSEQFTDVEAAFHVSYRTLSDGAARLFRLLALHPGPDISTVAAANLVDAAEGDVRPMLDELAYANLVSEGSPGRFRFHDLLRAYAVALVASHETEEDRRAAVRRMLDFYVHTAHAAAMLVHPFRKYGTMYPPRPAIAYEEIEDRAGAFSWVMQERRVIQALVEQALSRNLHLDAFRLAGDLLDFLRFRGDLHSWSNFARMALDAAERIGEPRMEAVACANLAQSLEHLNSYNEAYVQYERAQAIFEAIGDRFREARIHLSIGILLSRQHRHREALARGTRAHAMFKVEGDLPAQGWALSNIGWFHAHLGQCVQALDHLGEALVVQQQIGDRRGSAYTLEGIGLTQCHVGRYQEAIGSYEQAISLLQKEGDRYVEATVLERMGDAYAALSSAVAAQTAWREALAIFEELGHPGADQLRGKLGQLVD